MGRKTFAELVLWPAVVESTHHRFSASPPVGGRYTFGGRQGRMSPTRQRAFDELVPRYRVEAPLPAEVTGAERLVVEIGCGKGDATAAMAVTDDVGALVVACEPNRATLAHLAQLLDAGSVTNVRLWLGDAFDLLAALAPGTVAEIRAWFPDPWPKARHADKRLVMPERLAILVDALQIGGQLRIASDAPAYADEALAAIRAEPRLDGGVVPRPPSRPITKFEARGLAEGRPAVDLVGRRVR